MLNEADIGKKFPQVVADVEKGRLRFFAKAIGETDPIYTDEEAAKAAGYTSLPIPPTFIFCLKMDVPRPFENYENVGAPLEKILHGKQKFQYYKSVVAGDTLTFDSYIADIYHKKAGAMGFLVEQTKVTNQHSEHVADMISTLVVRQ